MLTTVLDANRKVLLLLFRRQLKAEPKGAAAVLSNPQLKAEPKGAVAVLSSQAHN